MSYICRDYQCPACGTVTETLERRGEEPDAIQCQCGHDSVRILSGTHPGTVYGAAVSTSRSEPAHPKAMNTESLGDGGRYSQWRRSRRAKRADAAMREMGIAPKVYSV